MTYNHSVNRLPRRKMIFPIMMALFSWFAVTGCSSPNHPTSGSVGSVWQQRHVAGATGERTYREVMPTSLRGRTIAGHVDDDTIATVNGTPIPRRRLMELLIRSRGSAVLEQLIGLETAMQVAAARGLKVSQADIDRERDLALRRLGDPLAAGSFDRAAAERVLETVLARRNVSREEFDILSRRNAYLRKVVSADVRVTEEQLRQEFRSRYGPKFQVRHIQLATAAEAAGLRERIDAGEDFANLATRYSANTATAQRGGSLDPFSADDERIPPLLRATAAHLQPGEVSSVIRVGDWHHLLKLERLLAAREQDFDAIRDDLEVAVRGRHAELAMFDWFEKLFREATIEIHDPVLAAEFAKAFPD